MGPKLIVVFFALEVSFITVCVVAGFATGRQPHFRARVFARCLSVPALVLFVVLVAPEQVAVPLAWLTLITAMLVVPALACRRLADHPPGPTDENGGGGSEPDRPSGSPEPPGGIPLPDADPSRVRVRDHSSPKIRYVKRWREQRPQREPVREPPKR